MVEISRRNPGECIEGKDDAIAYLNAAAETGDPTLLQAVSYTHLTLPTILRV